MKPATTDLKDAIAREIEMGIAPPVDAADPFFADFRCVTLLLDRLGLPPGYAAIVHHLMDEVLHERGVDRWVEREAAVVEDFKTHAERTCDYDVTADEDLWEAHMEEAARRGRAEFARRMAAGEPWQEMPGLGTGVPRMQS